MWRKDYKSFYCRSVIDMSMCTVLQGCNKDVHVHRDVIVMSMCKAVMCVVLSAVMSM